MREPAPREAWIERLPAEARSFSAETDDELFFEGLLHWARRQEAHGRTDLALQVYQAMAGAETPLAYRERATQGAAVLQGHGSFGAQAERFFHDTVDQALSPPALLAMAGAGLAFRGSRLLFLRAFTEAGWSAAPLRLAASSAAFNVEALSFPLLSRLSSQAFGHRADWQARALGRDTLSSYLFLGGLRGSSYVAGRMPAGALSRAATMYGGVVAGNAMESVVGLRSFESPEALFAHSLAIYFQFQIAGRVLHSTLGSGFRGLERRMDALAESLEAAPRRPSPSASPAPGTLHPAWAGASGSNSPSSTLWMAMSQAFPVESLAPTEPRPLSNGTPLSLPAPIIEIRPGAEPREIPFPSRQEIASAMVQHRGNVSAAARELGLESGSLERKLRGEDFFSELSVFQSPHGGRMLFYRPALVRAHSVFGNHTYGERSLNELKLNPETLAFVGDLGIRSVWDLLLTNRGEFHQSLPDQRSLVEAHLREIESKFDQRISANEGKIFQSFPLEDGFVKAAMAETFADYPLRDLGLEPRTEAILHEGGLETLGILLRRPIPQWIPRESLPSDASPGRREQMTDSVIRGLFALLHGAPPRRYRAPVPDNYGTDSFRGIDTTPPPPPRLEGVQEGELLRRLVAQRGNMDGVSQSFGRNPLEIAGFIQGHDTFSELNIFQGYGKGRMLFYTPALRHAAGLWGERIHQPESLSGLALNPSQRSQLALLGVDSIRDLFLLTRYDFERNLGAPEGARLGQDLETLLDARLNQVEPYRSHRIFRPGTIKEAMADGCAEEPLSTLRLRPDTLGLLRAQGLVTVGDLMARPIPSWISRRELPANSPADAKADHIDAIIRSSYAMLRDKFRFPRSDGWE